MTERTNYASILIVFLVAIVAIVVLLKGSMTEKYYAAQENIGGKAFQKPDFENPATNSLSAKPTESFLTNHTNSTSGCGNPAANCSLTCPPGWGCFGHAPGGCGGNCTPPLSVHWDYYRATCQGKDKILIEWATLDEDDTVGFIVQWSNQATGPFTDASPFINDMGPGFPYQWLDTTTDLSPFSPQIGILNWYNIRELCTSPPPFCSQTGPFTTNHICQDETIYCGGIANLPCPEGMKCVCPKDPTTSDPDCTCQPITVG